MKKHIRCLLSFTLSLFVTFSNTSAVFAATSDTKTVTQTNTTSKSIACKKASGTKTVQVSSRTDPVKGTDSLDYGNITGTYTGTRKTVVTDHYTKGKTTKIRKTTVTTKKIYTLKVSESARKQLFVVIDPRLAKAWTSLGFSFAVSTALGSKSCRFITKDRMIQLGTGFDIEDMCHMMGHFLSFAAGNTSSSSAFRQIFEMERYLYGGVYKACALKSPQDFFAVCMREYCFRPQKLKKECAMTYQCIQTALDSLTDRQISICRTILKSVSK